MSTVSTDPFADPEFRDRLRKLVRLLASDHEQEADTARRMMLAQLAQHNLSAHDLADRLAGPAESRDQDRTAELRAALRHAEQRTVWMEAALRRAEAALAENARTRPRLGRGVRVGLAAALVVLPCMGLAFLAAALFQPSPPAPAPITLPPAAARGVQPFASEPGADRSTMFSTGGAVREVRRPGGWVGTVTFNGTELRENVLPGAAVRATLQAGARVVVFGTVMHDGVAWLEVSSDSGPGYVPASRVQKGG